MKSFNDTIAAGKLRRKRLLLAAVHFIFFQFFFFFVLSALPHPVSEGSGLKSRSRPLDRTRCSGLSANHKTWLPQKSAVARSDDTQQRHDRAPLPTALHAHTHTHTKNKRCSILSCAAPCQISDLSAALTPPFTLNTHKV